MNILSRPKIFKVFVSSPYSSETEEGLHKNIGFALNVAQILLANGIMPLVPHTYFTLMLDDNNEAQQQYGMTLAQEWLREADAFLSVLPNDRTLLTTGMEKELSLANEVFPPSLIFHNLDELNNWLSGMINKANNTEVQQEAGTTDDTEQVGEQE